MPSLDTFAPIAASAAASSSSSEPISVSLQDRVQVKFTNSSSSSSSNESSSNIVSHPPIYIPTTLRRYALSEIVNHLIGNAEQGSHLPFDFLIDGKFLTGSLQKYLDANNLSSENVLELEYVESMQPPKQTSSFQHDDWISSVKVHRQLPFICVGSYDQSARIWNMSGECIATLKSSSHSSSAAVKSVAWVMNQSTPNNIASNEKNMFALVGYNDGIVSGWMISNNGNIDDSMTGRTSTLAFECHAHTASIEDIAVNNNASQFATASYDSSISIWTTDPEDADEAVSGDDATTDSNTSRKKRRVDQKIKVKKPVKVLNGHGGPVSSLLYDVKHDTSSRLFSASWDHTVREWDIEEESNINTMNCENVILDIDQSQISGILATGHSDKAIRLWDPRVQQGLVVKLQLTSHTNWTCGVTWSPSSAYNLASASYDGTVKVWDIRSSTPLYSIRAASEDGQKVMAVDWFDGVIYSGGEDTQLRVHQCKI